MSTYSAGILAVRIIAEFEAKDVQVFDNYQTMLDECQDKVDIVTLPVPIHLHAPMAIAALNKGYHVLVEKPLAGSLAEVDQLIAAREASQRHCAVGFQAIYSPVIQTLKKRVVEGRLGQVKWLRCMALWPRNPSYYGRNNWAGKLYCDGRPVFDSPFNNALAHQIMNMLFLASSAPEQAANAKQVEAELFRAYPIESFDTGCLRAHTEDGVEVYFATSHACAANVNPIIQIEVEQASVHYEIEGNATITYRDGTVEVIERSGDARDDLFNNLADVLTGNAERLACTLELARTHVACIEKMHRATQIVPIPAAMVAEIAEGQRVIQGIDEAVRQGFATGRLFSELGASGAPFANVGAGSQ